MCGIIGYQGYFNFDLLKQGVNLIAHRGPDFQNYYKNNDARIALGHARLSIQDLSSNGNQPMSSSDNKYYIIFNGEIYDFIYHREKLVKDGIKFQSKTDTEVLLQLYIKYGVNFVKKINGIFTICIFDKDKNTLILARDSFGVKPLYYYIGKEGFAFCSEIKGLKNLIKNENINEVNAQSIHQYLTFLWCPGEGTPFKKIFKFSPGELMIIKNGKISNKIKWYYLPNPKTKINNISIIKKNLYSKIETAVSRQMISDVPIGTFLSGGLDSSTIAYFAKKINPSIDCFSINITDSQDPGVINDLPYAKKMANYLNLKLNIIEINSQKMSQEVQKMIYSLDEPLSDPAALNVHYITKLSRENGIKVLLSGSGGDDIFSGYSRHKALKIYNILRLLPTSFIKYLKKIHNLFDNSTSFGRRLNKLLVPLNDSESQQRISLFSWIQEKNLYRLYSQSFIKNFKESNNENSMSNFLDIYRADTDYLSKILLLEQRFFLTDHNLNYTDKMSMQNGVEVRVPFLDNDLVEYTSRIDSNLKLKGFQTKWILKKTMEGYLPNDIIYRKKTGFGAPLRNWIKKDLKHLINDYLSEKNIIKRGIFDYVAVKDLIDKNDRNIIDASYTIFSLLNIEIWFRLYID